MAEASIFRNFSYSRQGCTEEEKFDLITMKYAHFLNELIKSAEADTINKGVGSHIAAVKHLHSILVNPKKRVKWDELVKLDSFLSKLQERSCYENEITMCLEIEHYLESTTWHLMPNIYQGQTTNRKWQMQNSNDMSTTSQNQNKQLIESSNSWTPVSVSPRARTTVLAESEQPTTVPYCHRMYGNRNFSQTTCPVNWESDCDVQGLPNGHWNRNNWKDNYRNWDGNAFTSTPKRNERFNYPSQQMCQRFQLPETPKENLSKIRDPRLLSGRVNSAAINIHSPCPPSVYVPTSRKMGDEIETPRSPSPELDVPMIPPVIIRDVAVQEEQMDDTASVLEDKEVFSCKHCSYIGKKIIFHYVNQHPGKEVPIYLSKELLLLALSKDQTTKSENEDVNNKKNLPEVSFIEDLSWIPDKSIFQRPIDCKICGYSTVVKSNLIQHLISHRNSDNGTSSLPNLYCLFCEYFINSVEEFRDHITKHTGEFNYTCGYCEFKGFSSKSVKTHISNEHVGKSSFLKRDREIDVCKATNALLGFVCSECRFVQLSKENVVEHVRTHGNDKDLTIIEINLARLSKPNKTVECNQVDTSESDTTQIKLKDKEDCSEKHCGENSQLDECIESTEIADEASDVSNENSENEPSESDIEEQSNSPPHLEPEHDATMSDEENEADLALLAECGGNLAPSISETISRLQSMLRKGVKRSSLPPPILEPMDGKSGKTKDETANINAETSVFAFKCGAKGCGFFCSEETVFLLHLESLHTPREAPCTECGGCFAQWKLLVAHIRLECEANGKLPQYACGLASCDYATNNEQFFFTHTRTLHKKEMQLPCCYCQKNFTLVTSLVRHLKEGCRAAKVVKRKIVEKIATEETKKVDLNEAVEENGNEGESEVIGNVTIKVVYNCPICDHKSLEREVLRNHIVNSHLEAILSCPFCAKELGDVDVLIDHIESEHDDERISETSSQIEEENQKKETRKEIKDENTSQNLEEAEEHGVDAAFRDPAVECLALKSPFALAKMLKEEKLMHLFKCMGRSCVFAASQKEEFVKHLSNSECNSRNICCYCMQDFETAVTLVDHVVSQHSFCSYQCKYCFYRAIVEDYIYQHQQKRHAGLKAGYLLCCKDLITTEPEVESISSKFILPYKCALSSCQYEETDPEKFREHTEKEHSDLSLFSCHHCTTVCNSVGEMITHYKVHGYNNYQCAFCLYGSETEEELRFHLCTIHPNKKSQLNVRSTFSGKGLSSNDDLQDSNLELNESEMSKDGAELKVGHALFQCGYPPCDFSSKTAETLREHMITCSLACIQTSSTCPHCRLTWRTMTLYLDHLVNHHGGRRFICGRCPFRGPSVEYVQNHMKLQHGISPEQIQCKIRDGNSDPEIGECILQEYDNLATASIKVEGKTPEKRMVTRKGTMFGLDDVERLPMQSIFPREVLCALCGYATKVRSNLIRHLQLHKKNEDSETPKEQVKSKSPKTKEKCKVVESKKQLDNERNKVLPQYIANTSLYRCAVQGCDYLALDNTMYKYHVTTLHPDVSVFPCPHCGDRTSSLDRLLIHFRLHGPRLYKCSQCSYVSYRLHQVETHISITHENRFLQALIIRENTTDEEAPIEPEVKSLKKRDPKLLTPMVIENNKAAATKNESDPSNVWCCAICTHPGPTKSIIKNHLQTSHGVRSEFKCGICSCVSNAFESVRLHFVSRHPNKEVKIMPLIVKAKDYDPNNLYISAPKDSTCGSSSASSVHKNSFVVQTSKPSMAVTRRASLTAAVAAAAAAVSKTEVGTEIKVDGGSSKDLTADYKESSIPSPKDLVIDEKNEKPPQEASAGQVEKLMFVCPVCHEYKTRFRGDMRIHIYRELQYRRVQCLRCNSLFVSEKEAKHHSLKTHQGQEISLQKNEVPEREIWVKEQLDNQVRSWGAVPRGMHKNVKNTKVVVPEDISDQPLSLENENLKQDSISSSNPITSQEKNVNVQENTDDAEPLQRYFRYYCTQCHYQCEGTTDLRKHIFRHLKFKPFHCTYCSQRFSEKQQIRNHHNFFHADKEFICQRQPNLEPERFVDELLYQQRMEWKDKKKNATLGTSKAMKTAAQSAVNKMAEESAKSVTSNTGSLVKVYACRHDGCNFSCDQLKGLKVHLMAHLRQARFRCGYCNVTGSSQYQVRRHCLSIHTGKKVLVSAIYNRKIDNNQSTSTSTVTQETSTVSTSSARSGMRQHCCPYCLYSHSLPKMISRHLMRHYVEKPFQCGHCKRTGIEKFDILYHCKKVHPQLEPKVIETPLPSNPEIKPILRRGHYSHVGQEKFVQIKQLSDASAAEIDENVDSLPSDVNMRKLRSDDENTTLQCVDCKLDFQTIEEMQAHSKEIHKSKASIASTKAQTIVIDSETSEEQKSAFVNNRCSLLKCIYCDLASDSLKLLRKHCHESHIGNEVRLRKLAVDWEPSNDSILRCGYCGFAVTQMTALWNHHATDHAEKCVKFRIAVRKSAVSTKSIQSSLPDQHVFRCSYCSDPCDSLEQMVKHWKMFHGHLELKYKTPTGEEGIISKEITDGVLAEEENKSEKAPISDVAEAGSKMYGCAQCKYESDKYDMVRQHLFRHLQRFSCQKCKKMYPFEYELRKHVEVHHSGLVLDTVKNPEYNDQEKEELIRNIRVWFVGNNGETEKVKSDPNDDVAGGKRKQVARKSLRGMSQVTSAPKLNVKAKKSSSCRLQTATLLQETLSKNLPGVEQMQHQIISDLVKLLPMNCDEDFACPAKKLKIDDNRVSLSLDDLHKLVNIEPFVKITRI